MHEDVGIGHEGPDRSVRRTGDEILERQRPDQAATAIHHEHLSEVFDLLRLPPNRFQRLARRLGVEHGDQVRGHPATGGLLVVAQQALDVGAVLDLGEDPLLRFRLELAQQVGGVVVVQLLDDLGRALRSERGQRLLRVRALRHLHQRATRQARRHRAHDAKTLLRFEERQDVGQVGGLELLGQRNERVNASGAGQLDHRPVVFG